MSRLPTPGGDDGNWGDILNEYLNVAHNTDGSLKSTAIPDGSITPTKLSQGYVPTSDKGAAGGVATLDGMGKVPASQLPAAGSTPDADATTKGVVQLAGDLGGTAAAPTVPALAGKADDSTVVHKAGAETLTGAKDFTGGITVNGTNVIVASDSRLTDQRIPTDGSVTDSKVAAGANIAQSKIANLTSDLAAKEPTVLAGSNSQYYRGDKTWQTLDKTAVGLGNVDNTSDANKPISTAVQAALNTKADATATISSTTIDAKGDLLVGTANDTVSRQAVGADGQVLTADSTQSTGVKWAPVGNFIQGQGIAKITVGTSAPSNPQVGDLWVNT